MYRKNWSGNASLSDSSPDRMSRFRPLRTVLIPSALLLMLPRAHPVLSESAEVSFRDALAAQVAGLHDRALPAEEALNAQVDSEARFAPVFSGIEWQVPSDALPPQTPIQASNNNVALGYFEGRLFMAWRTGPKHFASPEVQMHIVSSTDWGRHWDYETTVDLKSDMREPLFTLVGGRFIFCFFQAGVAPTKFEPKLMWRMERFADGGWSPLESWGQPKEITWDIKVRYGKAWRTSYAGDHYSGNGGLSVFFTVSSDGLNWTPVNPDAPFVYHGGDSEAAVEFLNDGTLWGITRNEDGDDSGFGSHLVTAPVGQPGLWRFPARSDPERYDSPRMFKHGDDLYLIARRDIHGPFDHGFAWLPRNVRKFFLWAAYGLRPKRTTLYRIDREAQKVVPLVDLPSDGDTSFASLLRVNADTWLVANYTSPLRYPERTWLWGQLSSTGTQIYFTALHFVPVGRR